MDEITASLSAEVLSLGTAISSVPNPLTANEAWVERAYWSELGRPADPQGKANLIEFLAGGNSRTQARCALRASDEAAMRRNVQSGKQSNDLDVSEPVKVAVVSADLPFGVRPNWQLGNAIAIELEAVRFDVDHLALPAGVSEIEHQSAFSRICVVGVDVVIAIGYPAFGVRAETIFAVLSDVTDALLRVSDAAAITASLLPCERILSRTRSNASVWLDCFGVPADEVADDPEGWRSEIGDIGALPPAAGSELGRIDLAVITALGRVDEFL
jgi:hypothetical protein